MITGKGWWGDNPPYHVPVFVLTNHKRDPIEMEGGTIFHFVTNGINNALDRAFEAAEGKNVRLGGGILTIQQYLREKLIDDLHIAISPIFLGRGQKLFSDIDLLSLGYKSVKHEMTENTLHVIIKNHQLK